MNKIKVLMILAAGICGCALSAQKLQIKTDKPDCVYKLSEPVTFTFSFDKAPAADKMPEEVTFKLLVDGAPERTETLAFKDGTASIKADAVQPGWVRIRDVMLTTKGKKVRQNAVSGAVIEPEKIVQGGKRPADFDAFWDAEIAKLKALPLEVKLEDREANELESRGGKVFLREFTINCPGPMPSRGLIAMPKDAKEKSLPIVVMYQGHSHVAAHRPFWYADKAIVLCVNKFGIPNDKPNKELREQYGDIIKGYQVRDIDDRDKCFFKWIILRDLRAQQFAKTLPQWNGKMYLSGESMGGGQALICGSLDPDVNFIMATVPALCDHNGAFAKRANGWPGLWQPAADGSFPDEKARKISETAEYFDTANFVKRLKPGVELAVSTGSIDVTCPPSSVIAMYNAIPEGCIKHLTIKPDRGHGAGNDFGLQRLEELTGSSYFYWKK